jgi:hypothetical protein
MRSLWNVIRTEHPLDVVREAVWRGRRRLRQSQKSSSVFSGTFRRLSYFRPEPDYLSSGDHGGLLKVADRICACEMPVFGFGYHFLGQPPQWNKDFISGKEWEHVDSASLTVVRHDGSDVKIPWEISRLQFLPVLAKAFCITGRETYLTSVKRLLQQWIEQNPAGVGVNWTIAMEAALRAISICLTLELLGHAADDDPEWLRGTTQSLWEHLNFIESHNEFSYFVTSNHYLSNIVGLFVLAAHLDWPAAEAMRRDTWSKIEREMQTQVYADGGDHEASLGYHVLVTQLFTTASRTAELASIQPSRTFTQSLARMYKFLDSLSDGLGHLPHVGDCDDGRVEWTSDDLKRFSGGTPVPDSLACTDLIGLGHALQGSAGRFFSSSAAWYGLEQSVINDVRPAVSSFTESGLIKAEAGSAELWFTAVPSGIRGKGSHTHNDKLAVVLSLGGTPLLVDSGTFTYTGDAVQRNQFRSTRAHSTVLVDGLEQNEISAEKSHLFRLGNEAQVESAVVESSSQRVVVSGSHTGFSRVGVRHSRSCELQPCWLGVVDRLEGQGKHQIELSYVVDGRWKCELHESSVLAISGEKHVITAACQLTFSLYPWKISRVYGSWFAATRIAILAETPFPMQITTEISWE